MDRGACERFPCGVRLAYHWQAATASFWQTHWGELSADSFADAEHGHVECLPPSVLRWLPRDGRILEAGCGPGTVVLALRTRGYQVEGVEWAADLVQRVQALRPDLPVRAGDVTALAVPDGTYRACLSLGVCEHRAAGPEPFLREAHRLLVPGGVLLVSVPHYHVLRRALFGRARVATRRGEFYQYAFTPGEFRALLRRAGFTVVERTGYGVWYGLCDDLPALKRVERLPVAGRLVSAVADRLPWLRVRLGHMVLFVAVKGHAERVVT